MERYICDLFKGHFAALSELVTAADTAQSGRSGAWSKMRFLLMYFVWEECHAWCMWRVDECFVYFFLLLLKQQDNWQRACFALFVLLHDSYVHYLCVHASSWFYRLFFNLYSAAIGHHIMTRAHILKLLGSGASLDECPLSLLPLVRRI